MAVRRRSMAVGGSGGSTKPAGLGPERRRNADARMAASHDRYTLIDEQTGPLTNFAVSAPK